MKQDKKRTGMNKAYENAYKQVIKTLKKGEGDADKLVKEAYSKIDKAKKKGVIHANKANRLKSNITKLVKKNTKSSK